MDNFESLGGTFMIDREDEGRLIEMYVSGIPLTKLSAMFKLKISVINAFVSLNYYGVVPKALKTTITLKSKEDDRTKC